MAEPVRLVGAALVREGRLLLGRRGPDNPSCPDAWDLFGGHVEVGESFAAALAREMEEELGVRPVRYREVAAYPLPGGGEYRVFRVDEWCGDTPALRNHEHSELGWFSAEEACALEPLASLEYRELFQSCIRAGGANASSWKAGE